MPKKIYKLKEGKFDFLKFNPLNIIIFVIFSFCLFLIYNLYQIQVIDGEKYSEIVIAQNKGYFTNKVENRGNIYFQNKNNVAGVAMQNFGYTLALVPKNLKNSKKVFEELSSVLDIDKDKFFRLANKKDDPYEELKTRISDEDAKKIIKKQLKGVILVRESWRVYPFNDIASKIIGFLDYEGTGKYGLEKQYDDVLKRGDVTKSKRIFDLFFQKKDIKKILSQKKISKEGNLISSIDIETSIAIEKILLDIDERYNSEYSAAIIIKPESGEIVAMVDTKYGKLDFNKETKHYKNIFVENRYEFGSIFKPLVVAIGLEEGVITEDFSYNDKGCVKISKYNLCNFDGKGRGKNVSLQTVLTKSLNTGMIEIEKKIGHKNFLDFLLKVGVAEETNIDLSGEVSSNISSLNSFNNVNYATASYGQGISFTPIAILRSLSSLANGGFLVDPHVIKKIDYGDLIPEVKFETEKKKVFSSETANKIEKFLSNRADELDTRYLDKNYSVATKTGTAQVADKKGGYYEDKYLHSIFGFFPVNAKPEDRFAILLFTLEPKNVRYAVYSLTKPFYEIVSFLTSYYQVKPDRAKLSF